MEPLTSIRSFKPSSVNSIIEICIYSNSNCRKQACRRDRWHLQVSNAVEKQLCDDDHCNRVPGLHNNVSVEMHAFKPVNRN